MLWWFRNPNRLLDKDLSEVVAEKTDRVTALQARLAQVLVENYKLQIQLKQWEKWMVSAPIQNQEGKFYGTSLEQ